MICFIGKQNEAFLWILGEVKCGLHSELKNKRPRRTCTFWVCLKVLSVSKMEKTCMLLHYSDSTEGLFKMMGIYILKNQIKVSNTWQRCLEWLLFQKWASFKDWYSNSLFSFSINITFKRGSKLLFTVHCLRSGWCTWQALTYVFPFEKLTHGYLLNSISHFWVFQNWMQFLRKHQRTFQLAERKSQSYSCKVHSHLRTKRNCNFVLIYIHMCSWYIESLQYVQS